MIISIYYFICNVNNLFNNDYYYIITLFVMSTIYLIMIISIYYFISNVNNLFNNDY